MNRADLVKRLELVQEGLAKDDLVGLYGCFVFRPKSIMAYNGQVGVISKGGLGTTPFATMGRPLLGLLQNSAAEELNYQVNDHDVVLVAGKSNVALPLIEADLNLIEEPKGEWTATLGLDQDLLRGIEICLTTVSRDQAQPAIMGVCINLDLKPSGVTLYSCDGDAITRFAPESGTSGRGVYTLPNAFCDTLLKVCRETGSSDGMIELSRDWAKATLESGYVVYGLLIANDNPLDHAKQIADSMKGKVPFVPVPLGLNEALARARVLADPETGKTELTVAHGKLMLRTTTSLGDLQDELNIKGHPDVQALTHASLVQRGISICDEISIRENVTAYQGQRGLLQVVGNIGK